MERLILDTGVLVRLERRATLAADVLPAEADLAIAAIVHARRTGRPRGAHDLQIAATARAAGRLLVTTDRSAFDDLPGVGHRVAAAR